LDEFSNKRRDGQGTSSASEDSACRVESVLAWQLKQIAVLPVASLKSSFYSLFLMFLAKRICERSVEM